MVLQPVRFKMQGKWVPVLLPRTGVSILLIRIAGSMELLRREKLLESGGVGKMPAAPEGVA
jgi:hypothetical protein